MALYQSTLNEIAVYNQELANLKNGLQIGGGTMRDLEAEWKRINKEAAKHTEQIKYAVEYEQEFKKTLGHVLGAMKKGAEIQKKIRKYEEERLKLIQKRAQFLEFIPYLCVPPN